MLSTLGLWGPSACKSPRVCLFKLPDALSCICICVYLQHDQGLAVVGVEHDPDSTHTGVQWGANHAPQRAAGTCAYILCMFLSTVVAAKLQQHLAPTCSACVTILCCLLHPWLHTLYSVQRLPRQPSACISCTHDQRVPTQPLGNFQRVST